MPDRPAIRFPEGFLWGAATSSYQIEGAVHQDGRGPSIWDTQCHHTDLVADGHTGDIAADHYNRWADDVELMSELGLGSYRFSVAWPRIQPQGTGPANQAGLDFYSRLVDRLLEKGITPMLTLYHWDLPQALEDEGGWPARDTARRFADYAAIVFGELHDRVGLWATHNEPWCSTLLGYAEPSHAPGRTDPVAATRAIHHLNLSHGLAVEAMRAIDPGPEQGVVINLLPIHVVGPDPDGAAADGARRFDALRNRVWTEPMLRGRYPEDAIADLEAFGGLPIEPDDLERIAQPLDWLGLNYYHDGYVRAQPGGRWLATPGMRDAVPFTPEGDRTDMGWPITPDGLRGLLVGLGEAHPDLALYVTENGCAYDDPVLDGGCRDPRRIAFLDEHLRALHAAIEAGVDVRGYMHWSLLDNFEWSHGYHKRFGLVHVDYETQQRTPRDSARWYRDVIARNGLEASERQASAGDQPAEAFRPGRGTRPPSSRSALPPASVPPADAPYRDASLSPAERAADLLGRMSRDEKLAQLGAAWPAQVSDGETFDDEKARDVLALGIGQITRISGSTLLAAEAATRMGNDIQRYLVERTRLGIPAILHEESLHGLTAIDAVVHPQSIGLAATWEPERVERMARLIGTAARARGARLVLSPVFDLARDPRWGRTEETYGEDTYLVMAMGTAYVRGVQAEGVLCCGKHLVAHGVPDGGRNRAPVHLGARELREQHLLPFEAAVRQERIGTMMHAYHEIDGVPCMASHELLTGILRHEWGFDGVVVADYDGVNELILSHQVTDDPAVAASMTLRAGLDQELPRTLAYGEPLKRALDEELVDEATLDLAVGRVLRLKFELGLFESPYADPAAATVDQAQERALALESARNSMVLLENDGTLPLAPEPGRVALIGPSADDARNHLGDYAHQLHVDTLLRSRDLLSSAIPVADSLQPSRASDGLPTVLDELRERLGEGRVAYARGCGLLDGEDEEMATAVEVAAAADVAVLVLGERSGLTDDALCGETRDRLDLGLPGRQQELLEAVTATGTPVVLVLMSGRPLAVPWAAEHCAAVLHAWVPGDLGAQAIVDVLTGVHDPGGKLPVSVPRHVGQVPIYYAHKPTGGHSNWNVEYVDGSNLPLWPFGFGRSYTTFELSELRLDATEIAADGEVEVSVSVRNTGDRAGDEVVQLYVRDVAASLTRPLKELRGFARVRLDPGQRRTVCFTLAAEQLAFVDVPGRWLVEPGEFRLMVGTSSADLPLQATLTVTGTPIVLRQRSRYLTAVEVS